jgi:carbonic anhydrase
MLKYSLLLLSYLTLVGCITGSSATSKCEQSSITPNEILEQLIEGNKKYTQGQLIDQNVKARILQTSKGQYPKAVILSCLDSRVPVETVFNQGIGDIFVGRVAGNVINDDQLGSMEFATQLAGSKLVMVLGHTSCGAVKGACDHAKLGNLTTLLSKIEPAMHSVAGYKGERNSKNAKFVDAVVRQNVIQALQDIRKKSPLLLKMEQDKKILIVGAIYNLQTGKVEILPN